MSFSAQHVLANYEENIRTYLDTSSSEVQGPLKHWIDRSLSGLSTSARIFEIGSSRGRDADYIESLGYDVECTDAAQSFVSTLLEKGFNARLHNAVLDPIIGSYDLIFANAVLFLFSREEVMLITSKVITALKKRGRFAFSLKKSLGRKEGVGHDMSGHVLWSYEAIETMLKCTGFSAWVITQDSSGLNGPDEWYYVTASK